jgi:hypothetical protein
MFVNHDSAASLRPLGARALPPDLAARARPVSSAATRLLPVPRPLVSLFPDGALRRGSTTLVVGAPGRGATTLALALLATASSSGCWCAAAGLSDPGVVAMAELGIDLRRVVFVPRPKAGWAEAAGELLNGVDVVLVRPPGRARLTAARHLTARARERQSALVILADRAESWAVATDVTLTVMAAEWHGAGHGEGHLRGRRAEVRVSGRGSAGRAVCHSLWLPSGTGAITEVTPGIEASALAEAVVAVDAGSLTRPA